MDHHIWSWRWCYLLLVQKLFTYLIHHPMNRWRVMSVILHVTQEDLLQQRKRDLLHRAEKLCKYNFPHELLLNCKKNHKFPKGMQPKFCPSLCNDETMKRLCRQVLRKASLGLRNILLDKVRKKNRKFKIRKDWRD